MSRVILKMSFKHPNLKNTKSKNMSHVQYIATRPGTDKSVTEADLKKELEKGIEDLSSDDDTYVKYIDERPNSHGLFGQDGIEDLKEVQEELSQVNSFVWRGIVSLKESDAKELGYMKKDQWQDMLRKKIPDMANEMGISIKNLRWCGAVHMEKGHPHAHIMIWEKEPQRTIGVMSSKSLDNIRKMFTDEIFEEERFRLMNEKNIMRELINDLAKGDVSQATYLLKEVRKTRTELKTFVEEMNQEGVTPRLYSEEEKKIAELVQKLSEKLPGKGRANLKFMPEDVKEEVRAIADYMLQQPELMASLEKNLKAVEELTRMYTGKEEAIQKARDNAYKDMRDRISQIVLKGAVESQKDNVFYVDQELSSKAVDFIKNINNHINLVPEHTKVFNQIAVALTRTGQDDKKIIKTLKDFTEKENIQYPKESLKAIINQIRESGADEQDVNSLSSSKKVDYYLSTLKLSGATEQEAFNQLKDIIKSDSLELDKKLNALKEEGILKKQGEHYKLTNKGIIELLKVKDLDRAEKEILKMLESEGEEVTKLSFKEILDNKDVFSNLRNKDPEEFRLGKYDTRVRYEFGEDNSITLKELESKIYEKYTDDELNTNVEKAEQEFEFIKYRIDKLTLNGYVELDKQTGTYSFTDEVKDYFQYDQEKDTYNYTDEAIEKLGIPKEMEFTRYDANVSLSYIDQAENGILTADSLKDTLDKEIINKTAERYYNSFNELMDTDLKEIAQKYISIDDKGNVTSTEEGKWLGVGLNKLNKYFKESKGSLTDEKLKELCSTDDEFQKINKQLKTQVDKGSIEKDQETGVYKLNSTISDINKFLYQIYKSGGSINRAELKETLEKNIPNYEAEKQFKYLTWRLDNLKEQGYLSGADKEYKLTHEGVEKRADILVPERNLLKGTLSYLERLGMVNRTDEGFEATDKYYKYMKSIAVAKEEKQPRESQFISKDIASLIDRTQDKVDVGKIERTNERIATGKYINNEYEELKTVYEDIRSMCGVADTVSKTINNLSTTLLVSGVDLEETKAILNEWNVRANNIDPEKLNDLIDKAHKTVAENNLWGKTTIISSKDWHETFETLGISEKDIPKWIYRRENWKSFHRNFGITVISDIWKATWRELEKQRMQTEAQADYMKKQLNKQQSMNQSKEAIKEQIRKNKSRGLYRDDELEM